ncbi:FAD-dependent oxidoreductase [Candidatus Poribacteria bacterium]|nr:FAD-dependent oxidoreductase [Candidatus Poribacteria bacterium]
MVWWSINMSGIKYTREYDVLVAGGGIAGVAAALASARMGKKTVLVEKTIFFGGLATTGLIIVYLPLSDSRGNQVTFGIAEELLLESIKYGPGDIPHDWNNPETRSRYMTRFSPAAFTLALDKVLMDSGVELWLDTLVCDCVMDRDRITGVEVENKSGRGLLKAGCVIDATGDADVAYRAGAPCVEQDNWMSIWWMEASLDKAEEAVSENSGAKLNWDRRLGGSNTGEGMPEGMKKYSGTDGREVSEFVLHGRKLMREFYEKEQSKRGESGRKDIFPMTLPSMAQFRTTRRIDGIKTLRNVDFYRHFDDCVGMVADWRGGRDVWEVPYYTLVPQKVKGLLAAGRCISTEGESWEVMRVIQAAAHTGETAGVAASMAVDNDTTPDMLDITDLQNELLRRNFLLDVGNI